MNINNKVQELYKTKNYFVKLRRKIKNKKIEYWSKNKRDPDGKKRDRFAEHERIKFYENNKNIINKINKLKGHTLLDVGCGNGNMLSFLSKKFKKHGIEIDDLAINHASKYAKIFKMNLDNKILIKNKFDVIILYHVIEHIKEPVLLLKELKNKLNKNGHIIIGTPDFDCGMARLYKNKFRMLHDETHISLFSFESLCRLFQKLNLTIIDVHFPYFETSYFNKKNLNLLFNRNKKNLSPPFYGNVVNFILKK